MSFNFDKIMRLPRMQNVVRETEFLPEPVKAFVDAALVGIAGQPMVTGDTFVRVRATGHLCDGSSSYDTSTANVTVEPLDVEL